MPSAARRQPALRRYLDHNAGAPLSATARAAMRSAMDAPLGNPSSVHAAGREARAVLDEARAQVAALAGAAPEAVVFASGGTEAIALGLRGLVRTGGVRTRLLVGAAEHPAVHGAAAALAREGFEVVSLPVDRAGVVDVAAARGLVDERVALVAVQAANHETGVIQPVAEVAALARIAGARVFCDAVQAAGKLAISCASLGADAIAISAHKLGGPAGAGALVLAVGVDVAAPPGAHQERGRRPGTEPLLAIAGFGAAAAAALVSLPVEAERLRRLRERLETGLATLGGEVFAGDRPRTPNTTLTRFPGAPGPLVVISLDLAGFAVSTGAACSSGSVRPSAVLLAAGHPLTVAAEAVRVSIGRDTDEDDVDALLAALPAIIARVRAA